MQIKVRRTGAGHQEADSAAVQEAEPSKAGEERRLQNEQNVLWTNHVIDRSEDET